MSKSAPINIVDSDSEREASGSELGGSASASASGTYTNQASASGMELRASGMELRASGMQSTRALISLLGPNSIFPVGVTSVNSIDSTWISGTRLKTNASDYLQRASSSDTTDTASETDLDFSTPPMKTAVKAQWENTKI